MSLQEKVRNIVFYFIKKEYKSYLDTNSLKYIEHDNIGDVVDNFYIKKEKILKEFIRKNLRRMMNNDYPGALVENIIYDIFEDEHFAKNRIVLEIEQFQKSNSNTILSNNTYEVNVAPHYEYGLGINLSINKNKIIVDGFKKNPDNNDKLPAEESGLINVGDELVEIDGNNLQILKINKVIQILQGMNKKKDEVNIRFNSVKNNKLFDDNYKKVCVS
jgi:C-terminal processing protease CtpA/Prc